VSDPRLTPARIEFPADGPPRAPDFGDVYHARIGAMAQARAVFLAGNGLPARWAGRDRFCILETGLGLAQNFLTTWAAWRDDPRRCGRLMHVGIERHPPTREDLARALAPWADTPMADAARALTQAWPPPLAGLHRLDFDEGRVSLMVALGDIEDVLPGLHGRFDAFYLDGFAPDRNPAMWRLPALRQMARLAEPGATLATWSVARALRDGLGGAGFAVSVVPGPPPKREVLRAVFAPAFTPRPWHALPEAAPPGPAVVLGGGLAGAWCAEALARSGRSVTVLDRHAEPAQEASGNPAGLFHATVHVQDHRHSQWHRAAALHVTRRVAPWVLDGSVPGAMAGLLRLDADGPHARRAPDLPGVARWLDAAAASGAAGLPVDRGGWWFDAGGWLDPRALVQRLLSAPGVRWRGGCEVTRLERGGAGWILRGDDGTPVAEAALLVLAAPSPLRGLLASAGLACGPALQSVRGQLSLWPEGARHGALAALLAPVSGQGYALRRPDGSLLAGATAQHDDDDPQVRAADHEHNVRRLTALLGHAPEAAFPWQGRVGWRWHAPDRLPLAGAVPQPPPTGSGAVAQAAATDAAAGRGLRWVPRCNNLYVCSGLGSRGLTLAALAAELVAAQAAGDPWPMLRDLAEAVDPTRGG
jgi:tRNA 5-methylaminomethyl-2-thiouridine biosynthesis bifunctional protein